MEDLASARCFNKIQVLLGIRILGGLTPSRIWTCPPLDWQWCFTCFCNYHTGTSLAGEGDLRDQETFPGDFAYFEKLNWCFWVLHVKGWNPPFILPGGLEEPGPGLEGIQRTAWFQAIQMKWWAIWIHVNLAQCFGSGGSFTNNSGGWHGAQECGGCCRGDPSHENSHGCLVWLAQHLRPGRWFLAGPSHSFASRQESSWQVGLQCRHMFQHFHYTSQKHHTPPKFNIAPEKMMVGRWVSFWDCLFLGAMLNFRGVHHHTMFYASHVTHVPIQPVEWMSVSASKNNGVQRVIQNTQARASFRMVWGHTWFGPKI